MSSDEITLLRKIEETCAGIGMKASFADVARPLPVSGVSGRISSIPSPLINLVGLAALTEANVDDKIQQVIELYRREGTIFGWLVGPTSQPVNLRERLVAAGFTPLEEEAMWGMVLRDLKRPIPVNPDIRVERVPIEALYANVAVIAQAYGFSMTEETVVMLGRLYESLGEQASLYLAFAPDREGPVAFSSSVVDDEGRVVMLGGRPLWRCIGARASIPAWWRNGWKMHGLRA